MYFTHVLIGGLSENAAVACWGVFFGFSEEDVREQYNSPDRDPFACFGSVSAATAYVNKAKTEGLFQPD